MTDPDDVKRKCPNCNKWLPLSHFGRMRTKKRTKTYYSGYCEECKELLRPKVKK